MGLLDSVSGALGLTSDAGNLPYANVPGKKEYGFSDVTKAFNAALSKDGANYQDTLKKQVALDQSQAAAPYQIAGLENMRMQLGDEFAARNAAGGIGLDTDPQAQFRQQQMGLMQALQSRAAGEAPSAAELQMRQGLDRQMAAQQSLAAGARGISPGMAARLAAQGTAQAQGGFNQNAAMMRAQEQAQAEQSLMQALAGARGQDMSLAGQQAQVGLQGRQQDDAARNAYFQQMLQMGQAGSQANLGLGQLQNQASLGNLQAATQTGLGNLQAKGQLFGAATDAGGAGAAMLLSDERAKENIKPGQKPVREFLDALQAAKYDYKEGLGGDRKEVVGIMAQDLEKSEAGRKMVQEIGGLKHVDMQRALFMALASSADLNKRLKSVERRKAAA